VRGERRGRVVVEVTDVRVARVPIEMPSVVIESLGVVWIIRK
jgi:hypothetical protein